MARDERDGASVPAGGTPPRPRVSAWALMLGSGPRFARDAFGPVLLFYVGWKLVGFRAAILAATALAIAAYIWERRQARSGITAGIGLGIALAGRGEGRWKGIATGARDRTLRTMAAGKRQSRPAPLRISTAD